MDDLRDQIAAYCKLLKISSAFADRAMVTTGDTHPEYLYTLLKEEIDLRKKKSIDLMLANAGFPRRYTFDQFRSDEVQFPDGKSVDTLKTLDFYNNGENIIMYGGTGTGKTMLSICIGAEACRCGIPVKFYRTAALVNLLSEYKGRRELTTLINKLNRAKIIILDEFGYVPYDKSGSQLLFEYLSEIHEEKSIILNTNLEFSKWVNVLYDSQMTAALIGRLMHHCQLILFPGENNRLRESSLNDVYRHMAEKQKNEETVSRQDI